MFNVFMKSKQPTERPQEERNFNHLLPCRCIHWNSDVASLDFYFKSLLVFDKEVIGFNTSVGCQHTFLSWILLREGRVDTGRESITSKGLLLLYIGTTLAGFICSGNRPFFVELLERCVREAATTSAAFSSRPSHPPEASFRDVTFSFARESSASAP